VKVRSSEYLLLAAVITIS